MDLFCDFSLESERMSTPLPVIANVSRIVSRVVDRITGDRVEFPLMVASACVEALKNFGIESRVMYGQGAWIEVLEDQSVVWAGCWGENIHFWVATQHGEVVDLNTSVAHKKRAHDNSVKPLYSPPMLWSVEIPKFYRYIPEGVAELELTEARDVQRWENVKREISEKCNPSLVPIGTDEDSKTDEDLEFANEPILCSGRKLLDDSTETFRHFDRALSVRGIPEAPF
jgi:hypothetical protein